MNRSLHLGLCVAAAVAMLTPSLARAQDCPRRVWAHDSVILPGGSGVSAVLCFAEFDADDAGPLPKQLYVGGFFKVIASGRVTSCVMKWDGFEWTHVGGGLGGTFSEIVYDLVVHDADGPGPEPPSLYAGGTFVSSGGRTVRGVARLVGDEWVGVGGGVELFVFDLESHDPDGDGPLPTMLYAGGVIRSAGGAPANFVVAWDGTHWQSIPVDNTDHRCGELKSWDPDGEGPANAILFAADATRGQLYRLDGGLWIPESVLSCRPSSFWTSFVEFDIDGDGPGAPDLYMASGLPPSGTALEGVRRRDGGAWTLVAARPEVPTGSFEVPEPSLVVFDLDGSDQDYPSLLMGGKKVWRLNGAAWEVIFDPDNTVISMFPFDVDGSGPATASLFLGGDFAGVDGVLARSLVRFGCDETWETCVGDATRDKRVNFDDVTKVLSWWGMDGAHPEAPDLNRDNVVGATDVVAVLTSYGSDCEPAARPGAAAPGDGSDRIESFAEMTRRLATWGAE